LARTIRAKQYSIRTEQSYVDWSHRFLRLCGEKSTSEISAAVYRAVKGALERPTRAQDVQWATLPAVPVAPALQLSDAHGRIGLATGIDLPQQLEQR
jgi:hypothetical protein